MTGSELLRRHLSLAGKTATDEDLEIYAPDVVAEFPYAPEGHTTRLEGPQAIARFLGNIANFAEGFTLTEPTVYDTDGGFVAEYHGEATFKETGRQYSQDYIVVARVENGRIAHLREYYNPLRVLQAMGELD